MAVRVGPGDTETTRTPRSPYSVATDFPNEFSAALVAL
jgi:hypothetical protein